MKQNKGYNMKRIGITGGVGSGKSLVLNWFENLEKTFVCQADLVAHELQQPGNICYERIVAHFGEQILNENREINRARLGEIVFADSNQLEELNRIVHPEVNRHIVFLMEKAKEQGIEYFILEAALLHDPFYREILDEIWYIHVSESVRRERLAKSRGYSQEKMTNMMVNQPSEECFYKISDRVIENDSDFENTEKQLRTALGI